MSPSHPELEDETDNQEARIIDTVDDRNTHRPVNEHRQVEVSKRRARLSADPEPQRNRDDRPSDSRVHLRAIGAASREQSLRTDQAPDVRKLIAPAPRLVHNSPHDGRREEGPNIRACQKILLGRRADVRHNREDNVLDKQLHKGGQDGGNELRPKDGTRRHLDVVPQFLILDECQSLIKRLDRGDFGQLF